MEWSALTDYVDVDVDTILGDDDDNDDELNISTSFVLRVQLTLHPLFPIKIERAPVLILKDIQSTRQRHLALRYLVGINPSNATF